MDTKGFLREEIEKIMDFDFGQRNLFLNGNKGWCPICCAKYSAFTVYGNRLLK